MTLAISFRQVGYDCDQVLPSGTGPPRNANPSRPIGDRHRRALLGRDLFPAASSSHAWTRTDIFHPGRFARQLSYPRDNPDIAVVGSAITLIDASGAVVREIPDPLAPAGVERFLMEVGRAPAHLAAQFRSQA